MINHFCKINYDKLFKKEFIMLEREGLLKNEYYSDKYKPVDFVWGCSL